MFDVVAGRKKCWSGKDEGMKLIIKLFQVTKQLLDSLGGCGLLELFIFPRMRAQPMFLQRLVAMWGTDSQLFMVGDQELTLDVEDNYFIMGLSQRGATSMFTGRGGGRDSIDTYVWE